MHNKHVICEKPFTSNVNELDELIALAKQQNCLLFEAITNQYLPTFKEIKEKISEIGKISIISSNYSQYSSRYNAFKRGEILPAFDVNKSGGALMDLNVYNIHFVVGLFGAPNKVEYFANIEKELILQELLSWNIQHLKQSVLVLKIVVLQSFLQFKVTKVV